MNLKIILCLTLVLSSSWLANFTIAQSSAEHGQPRNSPIPWEVLPPITNADPSVRVPFPVHVPTRLKLERNTNILSATVDNQSLVKVTNLTVGTNMVTGLRSEWHVYPEGEPCPPNGGYELGGIDFNLGTRFWHTKPDGIPMPGKKYVVELNLTIFETDIPTQHIWSPESSKNYKVLWQQTLKQINLDTPTFMESIFNTIERKLPELASTGLTTGTSSTAESWHGEEFGTAGFALSKNPASHSPDLRVTIHRYASSDDALQDIERGLSLRPAMPSKEDYKGAVLYRYRMGSAIVICQSGLYVIEIDPIDERANPLVMKVLDALLTELDFNASKFK